MSVRPNQVNPLYSYLSCFNSVDTLGVSERSGGNQDTNR
jgi:hypothetical protein